MKTWPLFTLAFIFVQITTALVPKPERHVNGADWYFVNDRIAYEHNYQHCYILHDAQKRLSERLRQRPIPLDSLLPAVPKKGLTQIQIQIEKGCNESETIMWPSEKMNEQYSLSVSDGKIELQAEEIWGILHGLETIAQLVRLNQHSTGSYDPEIAIYTQNDIKRVLEYCRLRGVRVLPEFDTPGHTVSWGKGEPELLTKCYSDGRPNGKLGPVDPTTEFTYKFMGKLLTEVKSVFPEKLIHLGGDEVDFSCWASNPDIQSFMKLMDYGTDYTKLQSYYMRKVIGLTQTTGRHPSTAIVWQEVFDDGFRDVNNTIIHVWKMEHWQDEMNRITEAGFPVIYSSQWYLNYIQYGIDWPNYYTLDPTKFGGSLEQVALVRGGEATMWSEYVDETNLISRSWPRGAAVAERLWTSGELSVDEFRPRLEQLRCQMLSIRTLVPKPFRVDPGTEVYIVSTEIAFEHDYTNCYILHDAVRRLADRLRLRNSPTNNQTSPTAMVNTVRIRIIRGCDESGGALWPSESMSEMYTVLVTDGELTIEAEEIWGVLHGLETIAQLVYRSQTNTGAYDPEAYVYTQDDVKRVLNYCRLRGIRVMSEFDTPGHTKCWGKGYPDLLTKCYSEGKPDGRLGPVNPITNYTYDFMWKLMDEIKAVFPDNMIHLGGDEVSFTCWASNPDVQAFMEEMKFGDDYSKLQCYYMERLSELAQKAGGGRPMTTFVWQEVFDHGFRVSLHFM
ncbi:hexosaminidase [Paragonimus westermani]|uniref:Beta-hexosaminidase subunit alpha n=1 Tax=Paragonimus westermani TaxID=34504 RepID=A0A5J4NU80_9TREM|nr:hexosaminidase [Paragonimus westermani]